MRLREPSSRIGAIVNFATSEILARVPKATPEEVAEVVADALRKCSKYEEGEVIERYVFDVVRAWEVRLKKKTSRGE